MESRKHRVAILALENFVPFDFGIPYNMFGQAELADGSKPYAVYCCGTSETVRNGGVCLCGNAPLSALSEADTIVIPGITGAQEYRNEDVFSSLRGAAARGIRIASICTGAWILASSGLLDGLTATTHWEEAEAMSKAYPLVKIEPETLFVDNGKILTSAGLASGMDLCLHMIRQDYGTAAAERCADVFVLPHERGGCHPQRIKREPSDSGGFAALQLWLLENIHKPLALQDMAAHAGMSLRSLNRKFLEKTGEPPMEWLTKARVRRAQSLLESTGLPVERVAEAAGFSSAPAMRAGFCRYAGVSPVAWRKTYGKEAYNRAAFRRR